MIFKTCTQRPTRAASGKVLGALRLPLTMYADSRADVYYVIWGVSYFVAWDFWRSPTRNPLVTPLVLRVLGKKRKNAATYSLVQAGVTCHEEECARPSHSGCSVHDHCEGTEQFMLVTQSMLGWPFWPSSYSDFV